MANQSTSRARIIAHWTALAVMSRNARRHLLVGVNCMWNGAVYQSFMVPRVLVCHTTVLMNYSYPVFPSMVEFRCEEFSECHYEVGDSESLENSWDSPVADIETCMYGGVRGRV